MARAKAEIEAHQAVASTATKIGAATLLVALVFREAWLEQNFSFRESSGLSRSRPEAAKYGDRIALCRHIATRSCERVSSATLDELVSFAEQRRDEKPSAHARSILPLELIVELARLEGASSPRSRKRTAALRTLIDKEEMFDAFDEEKAPIARARSFLKASRRTISRVAEPLIDLDRVPAVPSTVPRASDLVRRTLAGTKRSSAKYAELEPLSRATHVAETVFGEAATRSLALQELVTSGILVLESAPTSWARATDLIARSAVRAKKQQVTLACVTRSIADTEPELRMVERALKAARDDRAYCAWLRRGISARRAEYVDALVGLEDAAAEARRYRTVSSSRRKLADKVHVVAVAGPSAVVPMLYELGGFNECPDPVTHAVVLGRWEREYGATVFALSHNSITLHLARLPKDRRAIAWAGIARHLYCSEFPNVTSALRDVVRRTWSFWWD
jgi:hypothetical protein